MITFDIENSEPNYWLSCFTVNSEAMCSQERTDKKATYTSEKGKSCPTEILETLEKYNAEGRPVWKPMHMQPIFKNCDFVSCSDVVSEDIFHRGVCLPSDIKMTASQQETIIEIIKSCFE